MPEFEQSGLSKVLQTISPEAWTRGTDFVCKVFSPLAEGGELISDQIRKIRFKTAMKTLQEAERICIESGIEPKAVPAKFLAPFLDKCSLEEESSDLVLLWAHLLATACDDSNKAHPAYIDILSQLSVDEARLLKDIHEQTKEYMSGTLSDMIKLYPDKSGSVSLGSLILGAFKTGEYGYVVASGEYKHAPQDDEQSDRNIKSLMILERQSLIKIETKIGGHNFEGICQYAVLAKLTPLGRDFISACEHPNNEIL